MLQLCMEKCGLTLRSGVRERGSGKRVPERSHEVWGMPSPQTHSQGHTESSSADFILSPFKYLA